MKKNIISFLFTGHVVGKPRMTQSDKWKNPMRPPVAAWFDFKTLFLITAYRAGYNQNMIIDKISVIAHLPGRKGDVPNSPHRGTPDLDNIVKAALDALTDNDQSTYNIVASKKVMDKCGECLEVTLYVTNLDDSQPPQALSAGQVLGTINGKVITPDNMEDVIYAEISKLQKLIDSIWIQS